jgi:hypothetical protein
MGSHPTLDHRSPIGDLEGVSAHLAPQQRTAEDQPTIRDLERAFDRLNPDYGVPADQRSHYGHQAVREREAALALGVRVAVHDSRQNDPNPVIWQPGQDYRIAEAIHAARAQPTRTRQGPERTGPER